MEEQVYNPGEGFRHGSNFGHRPAPGHGGSTGHKGMDYPAQNGTPIPAAADGVVVNAYASESYGNVVVLKHEVRGEAIYTAYAHQAEPSHLHAGDLVKQGDTVGKVGSTGHSTGPHLHFEVIKSEPNPLSSENRLVVGHHVYNPSEFKFPQTRVQTVGATSHENDRNFEHFTPQSMNAPHTANPHPELTNTAQPLIADATHHTQKWVADNGLQWNEQFNQAAHSVASAAHEKGMTGINLFAVNGGQIDFGHKEGFMLKTGSVETAVASNTDISKSLQAMAEVDQKQSQTHSHTQQQAHTQTNERGMRMG